MTGPSAPQDGFEVASVVPILRMYDVAATTRFYVEYLGEVQLIDPASNRSRLFECPPAA